VAVPVQPVAKPEKEIALDRVSYRYEQSARSQLSGVSVSIAAGSRVCLFGPSGAGKSTVLNLLAGLVYPGEGRVLCDGIPLGPETIDAWRDRIGYLPQQIYLFDDTLANNIAFGVSDDAVNRERVTEVGKIANLGAFVNTSLSQGYDTVIGEHGATLSGGQRQRVGIARTLYHYPDVLLFDESFTGLDAGNRAVILDNLFALEGKTFVFSSHETAVASRCDRVVVIEDGEVVVEGSYGDLLDESPRFVELLSRLDVHEE
jgi:ABC-type bacteriocin/lantibiotic exporter with double-glycine peptidase domain